MQHEIVEREGAVPLRSLGIDRAAVERHPALGHVVTGRKTPERRLEIFRTTRREKSKAAEIHAEDRNGRAFDESRTS